jgi:tetratricopeptide (TPR) repeat protein
MQEGTGQGCRKAVSYFQDTIELDSSFPRAWSGLALAHIWLARYGLIPPAEGFRRARTAALKALELDEQLAEAYLAIAQVQMSGDWDFVAAEASLHRALELDPDNAEAHSRYGHFLSMFGQLEPAIEARERALRLDPLSEEAHYGLADTLFIAGRYDEALHLLRRIEELSPDFPVEHLKARIALEQGLPAEALAIIEREKLEWRRLYIGAIARFRLGDLTAARQLLSDLINRYTHDALVQIAIVHTQMGEYDHAFEWLQNALEKRDPGIVELAADPEIAPLRSDPRFERLLKQAKLNMDDWRDQKRG